MDRRKLAGRSGEAEAAKYLRSRGYELLGMNYACRGGEIDIIAARDGFVAFVEVKLRSGDLVGLPREAVDRRKREKLRAAAEAYLSQHGLEDAPARFDVAEIYSDPGHRSLRLEYLENAFTE